jgi:hypothetical protein
MGIEAIKQQHHQPILHATGFAWRYEVANDRLDPHVFAWAEDHRRMAAHLQFINQGSG